MSPGAGPSRIRAGGNMNEAFRAIIDRWERQHGRKATLADYQKILEEALAEFGIHPREDGCYLREDFEPVWKRFGIPGDLK